MIRRAFSFFLLALLAITVSQPQLKAQAGGQKPAATIKFDRDWADLTPQTISITVTPDGHAKYLSHTEAKPPDEADDYQAEVNLSSTCVGKLFLNATQVNFFDGDFAFKKHTVASTGKKTLTYSSPDHHGSTTYDYSENKAIQEITNIFAGVSATIEAGRKLKFKHKFDKLGLEDELKGMESAAQSNNLVELQLIQPLLEAIAADTSVLNIARQRAKRLVARANSGQ
jgi:hypothetical protein